MAAGFWGSYSACPCRCTHWSNEVNHSAPVTGSCWLRWYASCDTVIQFASQLSLVGEGWSGVFSDLCYWRLNKHNMILSDISGVAVCNVFSKSVNYPIKFYMFIEYVWRYLGVLKVQKLQCPQHPRPPFSKRIPARYSRRRSRSPHNKEPGDGHHKWGSSLTHYASAFHTAPVTQRTPEVMSSVFGRHAITRACFLDAYTFLSLLCRGTLENESHVSPALGKAWF